MKTKKEVRTVGKSTKREKKKKKKKNARYLPFAINMPSLYKIL